MQRKGMNMAVTRRNFVKGGMAVVAAVGAGAAMAGCASSGSSAGQASSSASASSGTGAQEAFMSEGKGKHLDVGVTGKLIKIAPCILADQLGYFKEEGADVSIQTIALADAMASISVNKLDIDMFGIVPTCTYVSQGAQVYAFGGTILNGSEMLVPESFNKDITKPDTYRGMDIACSREETGQMYLKNWCQEQGLELGKDVVFTYVDNSTTALEGLRSGQNDMFITNNAMGYSLAKDGIKVAGGVCDVVGDHICCRQNCSEQAYKEKYLSLVDFEVAILRGYDYYLNNKEDVIKRLCDYSAQEPGYVEAAMYGTDTYRNLMNASPDPYVVRVKEFYTVLKNIGEIDKDNPYTMDDYATPYVYRDALDIMLKREPNNKTYQDLDAVYQEHNV